MVTLRSVAVSRASGTASEFSANLFEGAPVDAELMRVPPPQAIAAVPRTMSAMTPIITGKDFMGPIDNLFMVLYSSCF
jgi:hypothetical protein